MTDPPRYPGTDDDTGAAPDSGAPRGTRRWMPVAGIVIAIGLLLLLVVLHLTGTLGPGVR